MLLPAAAAAFRCAKPLSGAGALLKYAYSASAAATQAAFIYIREVARSDV